MSEKNRMPTPRELKIMERNGVDPEGVAVVLSSDDSLVLLKYKTGDNILLHAGDKPWEPIKQPAGRRKKAE